MIELAERNVYDENVAKRVLYAMVRLVNIQGIDLALETEACLCAQMFIEIIFFSV